MKTLPVPQTYVVRVYRRGDAGPVPALAGTVETVPAGDCLAFDSLEGLGTILAVPTSRRRGRKLSGGGQR